MGARRYSRIAFFRTSRIIYVVFAITRYYAVPLLRQPGYPRQCSICTFYYYFYIYMSCPLCASCPISSPISTSRTSVYARIARRLTPQPYIYVNNNHYNITVVICIISITFLTFTTVSTMSYNFFFHREFLHNLE